MKRLVLSLIYLYKIAISPLLGPSCRFYPSCSTYTKDAVEKYGVFSGLYKGMKRILRCGPWSSGGVDLP